jgi:hypothetical protein
LPDAERNGQEERDEREIVQDVIFVVDGLERTPRDDLLIEDDKRREREGRGEDERSFARCETLTPHRVGEQGERDERDQFGRAKEIGRVRKLEHLHFVHRRSAPREQ